MTDEEAVETNWEDSLAQALAEGSESVEVEEAVDTPVETEGVEAEAVETVETAETDDTDGELQPPERWSDEAKAYFNSLDEEGRRFLIDREKDVESHLTKRTQEISDTQKRYERLDHVLQPYEQVAQQQGIDLTPHVAQAMQIYSAYLRDPVGTVKSIVQQQQLTPEQLGLVEDTTDPDIKSLRDELAQTKQALAAIYQRSSTSQAQAGQSAIEEFRNAKDEQGNAKHPHFDNVRHLMAPIVAQGKTLEDAYNEVVWASPEFRKEQEKRNAQAARQQAEKARKEKLRRARQSETLPSTDMDAHDGPGEFKGWDKALAEQLREMQE